MSFPSRAFIQIHDGGRLPPESAMVVQELSLRSVPTKICTTEELFGGDIELNRNDFVVGDFSWTKGALKRLGITMPEPPDYPSCLEHLLHRRIWKSTLGEVLSQLTSFPDEPGIFIKPAEDTKAFSGLIASLDWMSYLLDQFPPSLPVHCAEVVEIVSEYRVYVVEGHVRAVCNYLGSKDAGPLDMSVVNDAVRILSESDQYRDLTGCGLDFAVLRKHGSDSEQTLITSLLEVNDGYSLGAYEGLSGKDYTDMLLARWSSLMK